MKHVLLIGTFETKAEELAYLRGALERFGLIVHEIDVSLRSGGRILSGTEKLDLMACRAQQAAKNIITDFPGGAVALGVGGGTGGEIVLGAIRALPAHYPKVLVTTLAFDPRAALADRAITIIPTLCDIEGLNGTLLRIFERAAAMVAGLFDAHSPDTPNAPRIAVTTLGATSQGGSAVARLLNTKGLEPTVFHANGYGGAAFSRFVCEGELDGIIDLNVHELGRLRLAGAHVPMPDRFATGRAKARVVLPGGLNFLGLGQIDSLSAEYQNRPHYRHSEAFTHVKLSHEEIADQAAALAKRLNETKIPTLIILPMGGFSHEDRPGGAIEDAKLREITAETLEADARHYQTQRISHHINTEQTAQAAVNALIERMPHHDQLP